MMETIDDLRTLHPEGLTFCEYTNEGSVVSAGFDGDLKLYPGFYEEESLSVNVGSSITCLTVQDDLVVAANDVFEVKSFLLPSLQLENVLLRFTASINQIHIKNDKTLVGAASSDFTIKVVKVDGSGQKTFTGHEAPVLSLNLGQTNLVSSSCDGSLRIWNLSDQVCIKTLNLLPKTIVPDYGSHFSSSAKGDTFAVPCEKSIKVISADDWVEKSSLEEHQAAVTVVKWACHRNCIASGTENGEIFVWDIDSGKSIAKFQHYGGKAITSLSWSTHVKGDIIFTSVDGDMGCCSIPIQDDSADTDFVSLTLKDTSEDTVTDSPALEGTKKDTNTESHTLKDTKKNTDTHTLKDIKKETTESQTLKDSQKNTDIVSQTLKDTKKDTESLELMDGIDMDDDFNLGDDISIDDELTGSEGIGTKKTVLNDVPQRNDLDSDGDEEDDIIKPSAKKQKKRIIQMDDDEEDEDDIMPASSKKRKVSEAELLDNYAGVDNEHVQDDPGDIDVYGDKDDFIDSDAFDDEKDIYDIDNEDNLNDNNTTLALVKEGLIAEIKPPTIEDESSMDSIDTEKPVSVKPTNAKPEMELQDAFQSSATPSNLMHYFMLWNSVGIIRCHTEDDVSYIDVEFHDASTHHALHIPNNLNYTMAALSATALVFACESDDNPSKLSCTHFGSWDSNKEWDVAMPEEESIECIAVNKTHVVAATNERLLRVYSVSGTQLQLFVIPGPVVSIAMHDKQMILFYHSSGGFHNCHSLGIIHYRLQKNSWKTISDTNFALKSKTSLKWIGFTAEGTPVMNLSTGEVFIYHRQQCSWFPVANLHRHAKNKSDNYWVLGVEEILNQVRCIYCKGTKFPATTPRPIPVVLPFQIPLCEMASEKSIKEEELMKTNVTSSNIRYNSNSLSMQLDVDIHGVERQQIRLLMQLFALACKADQEYRAEEICNLLPSAESIGMAIQYASKVKRMRLAQRLTELARKRAITEEEEEEEEEDNFEEMVSEEEVEEDPDPVQESVLEEKPFPVLSSGPRMAVLGRKPNPFRQSVENRNDEEDSQESQYSSKSDVSSIEGTLGSPEEKPRSASLSNPFKVDKNKSGHTTGTDYFETLSSQSLSKKTKPKEPVMPQKAEKGPVSNKNLKKSKSSTITFNKTNVKKGSNINKTNEGENSSKVPAKKVSGFSLFLDSMKESNEENSETMIPQVMQKWKELSAEERSKWNEKAAAQINSLQGGSTLTEKKEESVKINDSSSKENKPVKTKTNTVQVQKEKKVNKIISAPDAKKVSEVKNASRQKLAAFSFQQK